MELFVEKTVTGPRSLWGTRVGRYRAPFGLSSRTDHAYTGFLRAPLIRYGGYWALSNNFLETGASVVAGTPRLFAEVSLGIPQDEDDLHRARGLDRVGRVQATMGDVIVGASYIHTQPFVEQRASPTATPSLPAWTPGGCAAASRCAANGSTAARSTARGPSAATPT